MKTSTNLKLLLPEGKDPVNITDITGNFETLDTYLADMQTAASDASKNTVVFSQASDRQNVASTESLSTLMSKICKWFADLKAAAFCTVANNETTTAEGVVLDARVGKKHADQLNGLYFKRDSNGKMGYATSETGSVTPFRNPTGDATAAEVLSGKVFSSASLENATGTMTNRGAWTGATTGNGNVTIPEGYHNGSGYVSGAGAYNAGVTYADGRTNTKSANYKAGYSAGETAMTVEDVMVAVVHVNSSASFYSYASGYSAKGGRDNKGMTSCTGAMAGYNDGEITIVTAGKYIYFGSDGTWHTGTLSAGTVITYYAHSDGVRSCFAAKLKG
jgi:hypothetical protein